MEQELPLGTLTAHGTLSGYVYFNLPRHVCRACAIIPGTTFAAVWCNGRLEIRQNPPEEASCTVGTPFTSARTAPSSPP